MQSADVLPAITEQKIAPPASLWRDALRSLVRNRSAQVGLFILGFLLLVAIFASAIAPYDPINFQDPNNKVRTPPCVHFLGCPADEPQHLFGLDSNGRDLFSRVVYGTQVSLFIGIATVTFGIIVGSLIGALARMRSGDKCRATLAHPVEPSPVQMVAVRVDRPGTEPRAIETLARYGAHGIERAEGNWQAGDWKDFDPRIPAPD